MPASKGTERVNFGASTLRAYELVLHQTDSPTYDTTIVAPTGQSANATITMPSATGTLVSAATVTAEIAAAVASYVPTASTTLFNMPIAGLTAGFITSGSDYAAAALPQSSSASTAIFPLSGLRVGSSIVSYVVAGALVVASGSDPATVDAVLYRMPTSAPGVPVSLGAITQVALTASAAFAPSKTLTAPHTVLANNSYFVLVTATTGANEDILIHNVSVTTA